jgi:DNA-binding transcriptional ArsR family regulator
VDGFAALADPTRRSIVEFLGTGERTAGEIAGQFPLARPTISRHLRVLRENGVVSARAEAQRRVYRLEPAALAEIDRWLARYRHFWTKKFDALEEALKR